ncbi:hypothetical protein POX_c04614 [Penicillium oxalicum]|uniref:hypothetical protein n=1 Tax=Penicillium oxalicum TaxID=69781 RepID=UPI0020B729DF|nr:hypothetical protein POX_c04614 [Penicillium oxalicum]KAI2791737.1 hypothetical protein POX_c04614 [Penicillium oxalicum]
MNVPIALATLRNASLDTLQQYTSDTLSTLEEVRSRLRLPQCETFQADDRLLCRNCKLNPPVANAQKCQSPATKKTPSRITDLFRALKTAIPSVQEVFDMNRDTNLHETQQRYRQDRRVNDILRAANNEKKATPFDKLMRSAAQRSLAMQYSKDQSESRVEKLCNILSSQHSSQKSRIRVGRSGRVITWVRRNLNFGEEKDSEIAEYTLIGVKQLVLENLLQKKLQSKNHTTTRASGVCALIALATRSFAHLSVGEIPAFIEHILNAESAQPASTPEGCTPSFLDGISGLSQRIENFLGNYDRDLATRSKQSQGSALLASESWLQTSSYPSPENASAGNQRDMRLNKQASDRCTTFSPGVQIAESRNAEILSPAISRSALDCEDISRSASLTDRDSIHTSLSSTVLMADRNSEHTANPDLQETQHTGPAILQSTSDLDSVGANQRKRKHNSFAQRAEDSRTDEGERTTQLSQKMPKLGMPGATNEENADSADMVMQEPSGFYEAVQEGLQTDMNNMGYPYWSTVLCGEPQEHISSADWLHSSIEFGDAAFSDSASRIPTTESYLGGRTNIHAVELDNTLSTMFDLTFGSDKLPNPLLWHFVSFR